MSRLLRSVPSRDIRSLLREAQGAGAVLSKTGGGHIKIVNPENNHVVYAASTGQRYGAAVRNLRSELRRAGFDL